MQIRLLRAAAVPGLTLACLVTILATHAPASADEGIDGLIKLNSEGCVKAIAFENPAPKKAEQVQPYCSCVYTSYYGGMSKPEQNELLAGRVSGKLRMSLQARLQEAKAQCRKKIGF